jgi:hypothetical protein
MSAVAGLALGENGGHLRFAANSRFPVTAGFTSESRSAEVANPGPYVSLRHPRKIRTASSAFLLASIWSVATWSRAFQAARLALTALIRSLHLAVSSVREEARATSNASTPNENIMKLLIVGYSNDGRDRI